MMNKIEKLLDLCIAIAEKQLNPVRTAEDELTPAQMAEQAETATAVERVLAAKGYTRDATGAPVAPEKKTRKPRTPKVPEAPAPEDADNLEAQLGVDELKKEELNEEESKVKMEEVTKQFVSLCKNDTPEDGKTRAIALMRNVFKVAKLGELTHPQRIKWIAEMEKGILEHK